MGKIHQDYRVFHSVFKNSYQRPLASISSKMLQHDAFYIRPNYFILIQFIMRNNKPPSIIFSVHFPCKVTSARYQFMYVISHINYFVMLLINLNFCTMKFLSEVIPLILLMFSFKTFWIGCSVILTLQVFSD